MEKVHFFSTFEPKICKSAILSAVSMSTLKILSRGYNMATQKKFETYKMLRYKELQSLVYKPLSPQYHLVISDLQNLHPSLHPKM